MDHVFAGLVNWVSAMAKELSPAKPLRFRRQCRDDSQKRLSRCRPATREAVQPVQSNSRGLRSFDYPLVGERAEGRNAHRCPYLKGMLVR